MRSQINSALSVRYKTSVVNPDGSETPLSSSRNMITDAGMDFPAVYGFATIFAFLSVGTGTNPVKRDSGAITFSRSGSTVTASASFFEAADATSGGRLLKFDTGEEMRIVSFTDSTHVTVGTSGTLAASQGTVWYVNDNILQTEVLRTQSYSTSAGENSSTFLTDKWVHRRTFLTPAFGSNTVIREIGWAPAGTGSLFGRDLVPAGGDSVLAGQKYKVQVELTVTYGPASSTACANVGSGGFDTSGTYGLEGCDVGQMSSDGNGSGDDNGAGSRIKVGPAGSSAGYFLATTETTAIRGMSATAPVPAGAAIINNLQILGVGSYASGSYYREFSAGVGENSGNSTNWRSIGITGGGGWFFRVLLASDQTKDNLHTLTFNFRYSWSRTLTN